MKKLVLLFSLIIFLQSYAQFPLPTPRDTSEFGKYLQRTMKLLATSTPTKKKYSKNISLWTINCQTRMV